MAKKAKLSEMTYMFKDVQILSLEGVIIEGDLEINISRLGGGFNPMRSALPR
jgi:acetyl-CoA decarbonylase/synthase, CODH/ACS complex subunit delta